MGIRNLFQRRRLVGGRKNVWADRVEIAKEPKIIRQPGVGEWPASGAHSVAYDLFVYKGGHKVRLVAKKYRDSRNQSKIAKIEFKAFQRLKRKGYPVPPTIRLVKIRGKKYVAITDLSVFGDRQTKALGESFGVEGVLGRKVAEELKEYIERITAKAEREDGINIRDSWEFVIDTQNRTVKAFILDLGLHSQPESRWDGEYS